jgi:putative ABC transport system permease protein
MVTLQNQLVTHESDTYEGVLKALNEEFPEVKAVTKVATFNPDNTYVRIESTQHQLLPLEDYKGISTDDSFFNVFSFPLVEGDRALVLKDPLSAVVSETLAHQFFNGNALGKILETDDGERRNRYTISGVMKDVPDNSHLKFDILVHAPANNTTFWNGQIGFWDWAGKVYVLLEEATTIFDLETKLNELAISNNGLKINKDDYGQVSTFHLQALEDIHLHSHLSDELEINGSSVLVYALIALVVIIVVIAWFNYINLSTAISTEKIKEIGVRKVVGASRPALLFQVLTESALFNFISVAIAFVLANLLFVPFANFTGIPSSYSIILDKWVILFLIGFFIISTFTSGIYPARVISSFYTISSLKGRSGLIGTLFLRKGLVVFQFTAAIALAIITLIAYQQLSFMRNNELGISIDNVLIVKAQNFDRETWSNAAGGYIVDSAYISKATEFKNDVLDYSAIVNATTLSHLPGQLPNWGTEFQVKDSPGKAVSLKAIGVDYDFLKTFNVKLLAGRNFSTDFPNDQGNEGKRAVLLNEAAAKLLGFKNPEDAVHQHISTYWRADYEVIGVVNSFRQLSMKENLTPIYFILQPRALSYHAINFRSDHAADVVDQVHKSWDRYFPDHAFSYFFLDEYFDKQYQHDQQLGGLMSLFAGLAIFIACMGLFGLTSYAIVQRTKEIGIRKVLGATVANVISLFTKDFAKLILIANTLAIPLVYWFASQWLENYATRISLGWWLFLLPFATILTIAMLTVGMQSISIALKNPAESLKYE